MSSFPRVSHYGTIHIGDLAFDGVVLEDGTRGYVQRQLTQAVGFQGNIRVLQIRRFLAEIAPNALPLLDKSGSSTVIMPHGGHAAFLPAGILSEMVTGVLDAAISGTLHHKQKHLVPRCQAINKALTITGEVALIDEATGYQYHREPDALQDFISRILRQTCASWERRFHPDYYEAIFALFGWKYTGQSRKPSVVGQITARWVYESVFPVGIMAELRERRGDDKLHQWLTAEGGLPLLEKQINAVTMIARSSTDLADFNNRCAIAFHTKGQMGFVFPAPEAAQ
jgi:hypothetical protein